MPDVASLPPCGGRHFYMLIRTKNQSLSKLVLLAGAEGLEPSTKVLESAQRAFTHANDDGKRFSNTNDVGS